MRHHHVLNIVLAFFLCTIDTAFAQTIEVVPNRVLFDEPAVIHVTGLQSKEQISIQAELKDGAGEDWTSRADFMADAQGTVDVAKQAPVSGSYKEVSAMGLVWSMRPVSKSVNIYRAPGNVQEIQFWLIRRGERVADTRLEQLRLADGVQRTKLVEPLHGFLFKPNTNGPHPAVLVVGGSGGGVPTFEALWLASHGYAALALAYFHYESLPPLLEAIPLEYFGQAIQWMMNRPDIIPDRIAVLGGSRGGELALQLGSMYPQLHAVVAYVPADVRYGSCCGQTHVPYAWTWKGQPAVYMSPGLSPNSTTAQQAAIAVEQTHGPILMISGTDDGIWHSSTMADSVVSRLKRTHFPYPFEHLRYPHAGHSAGYPETVPAWRGPQRHPISGKEIDFGGSVAGNALSSIDAAPKVLGFLDRSLKSPVK